MHTRPMSWAAEPTATRKPRSSTPHTQGNAYRNGTGNGEQRASSRDGRLALVSRRSAGGSASEDRSSGRRNRRSLTACRRDRRGAYGTRELANAAVQ